MVSGLNLAILLDRVPPEFLVLVSVELPGADWSDSVNQSARSHRAYKLDTLG